MRRLTAVLTAFVCCVCVSCILAEDEPFSQEYPNAGVTMTYPEAFLTSEGIVYIDDTHELNEGTGVYRTTWRFLAMTMEEDYTLASEEEISGKDADMFCVYTVNGGRDFSAVTEQASDSAFYPKDSVTEIGQEGEYSFYLVNLHDPDFAASVAPEFGKSYDLLCGLTGEIASSIICFEPTLPMTKGTVIDFETTDLDGNPVRMKDLFAQHAYTMVNIWGSWCGPCVSELEELQKLHSRFLEKDCAIIGLVYDDGVDAPREMIVDKRITYVNVVIPDDMLEALGIEAFPTTLFVDRDGVYTGKQIVGAYPDKYEPIMESLLK